MQLSDRWRPAALTGTRQNGYVRLEGGTHDLLQIRWQSGKNQRDLVEVAQAYISKLKRGSNRRGQSITSSHIEKKGDGVRFKWNGAAKAVGELRDEPGSNRVFILELSAHTSESIIAESHRIFQSFQSHTGVLPWSAFDFEVRLPEDLEIQSFKFLSGRILYEFKANRVELSAERWSLAESILEKHSFTDWAKSITGFDVTRNDGAYLHLSGKPPIGRRVAGYAAEAIVRHDAAANRLLLIKAVHKNRPIDSAWLP